MKSDISKKHLSIRVDSDLLDKFYYVAKYNGRSGSGQKLHNIRMTVKEFEKENGEITGKELKELNE